ncbi:DUF4367 domain-containing protein [Paenibacillus sp. MZ04-78.2]|uniref:DUF4367 domain-containing protein n=1 Tax=Paenibacillus sp. MZ04-78.2 TaxID=2962034 RepID=UPI0020B81066|nr:DUF4367 domain-containing protein [Paenibacillus sp. MZ04-78.2]MCP3773128.1 DUF4367 domain-containing protein [Paenibacillus sp. MZ04-78.2]
MRNLNHDDHNLKEMLKRNHAGVEIPNGSASWQQVQHKLKKIGRRKMLVRRMKLTAAIIACSFVISFFLNNDLSTSYAQIASLLKKVQGNIIEIFYEAPPSQEAANAKTTAPPEEKRPVSNRPGSSFAPEKTSLEEAKNKMAFPLLTPSYVPEKFRLDAVFITKEADGAYHDAYFEYLNEDGELLKISQRKIEGKTGAIKTDIHSDSGEFFDVFVGEHPAVLFVDRNGGITSLEWLTKDRIKIYISGPIAKEDILKIGASLQ